MARVFVAFRSFLAEDFSRFFLLALFTLYIVNLVAAEALRSFLELVVRPDPEFKFDTVLQWGKHVDETRRGKRTIW